ncbi:methyltransferase, FxLD system [Streptomyces sp. NPDC051578]|uniref:methyltransferase, FxLD system n=1 Tax=Streptomyces sp. NPDC051578 TaxID=3365662 RepID=UPI0037BC8FEA
MDWYQLNITFTDRATGRQAVRDIIGPALTAAEDSGHIQAWWYMNKQPWPLRILSPAPIPPAVTRPLHELMAAGKIDHWTPGTYEAETFTFGGRAAMDAAHTLFHQDSRHLLTYATAPTGQHLGWRETAVLLCSAMMRAAGLDWYEQGDVWDKVADLRPHSSSAGSTTPATARHLTAMRRLMTANAHALTEPGTAMNGHRDWVTAFEELGQILAQLAHRGELTRGLRAVLAHHCIFHANRAGLPLNDQHAISTIAREVVMGSSDNNASPAEAESNADSVSAVNTDTITTSEPEAAQLRNRMVDKIRANGHARTPGAEAALRNVPRHLFVPDAPLKEAYADTPLNTKFDTDGKTPISCASQPSIVALMLDQLEAQPGDEVLELGAGTGYNAGLIAHMVGESGHVTTIDVDDDLVEGARAHLAAAGIINVEAITRDGALGHAEGAPYDRIIATVGAHGIPHAWLCQLAPGGRLVVPQRLKGSVSRSIAYEERDGRWVSLGSEMNTFMPLRRGIADDDRRVIPLSMDSTVRLQAPAGLHIDAAALAGVLEQPRIEHWTGVTFRAMETPEWMELYVSCALPSGLVRMLFPLTAKGTHLTEDPYPSSTAAINKGAVTYLARRLSHETSPEGGKLWEFGVIGHGPGSEELATQVAEAMQTWDRGYRGRKATFEIQALDAPAIQEQPGRFAIDTPLNRIVVAWQ